MTKKPWETEDWHEAKGIIVDEDVTKSVFARRDYSIPCESIHLITQTVAGYFVWWCSIHHQPLSYCQGSRTKQEIQDMARILEETPEPTYVSEPGSEPLVTIPLKVYQAWDERRKQALTKAKGTKEVEKWQSPGK